MIRLKIRWSRQLPRYLGYITDISGADLDAIVVRDEQGKPVDYVAANPEAEPEGIESEGIESENNSLNLQHGDRFEQDNDSADGESDDDSVQRVVDESAGTVAGTGDRGAIRVFEERMGGVRSSHSDDSERNRREAESERLVGIAKE